MKKLSIFIIFSALTLFSCGLLSPDGLQQAPDSQNPDPPPINLETLGETTITEEVLFEWMQKLPPLPKVHYSWPLPERFYQEEESGPLSYEIVRLTHAASLNGKYPRETAVDAFVKICKEINDTHPAITARLAINYSPWHMVFPEDLPPTYFGPEHDEEIARFREKMESLRDWIAEANARHGTNIPVGTVMLDSEHFYIKRTEEPGAEQWNQAMDAKYTIFYQISKEIFPNAYVEWYNRGYSRHFTRNEMGDGYSVSLYRLPYEGSTRNSIRRINQRAQERDIHNIVPWVALGSGYQWNEELEEWFWTFDWNYDPLIAWSYGNEINQFSSTDDPETLPGDMVDFVSFYPRPFEPRGSDGLTWGYHFIWYVLGAHQMTSIPE